MLSASFSQIGAKKFYARKNGVVLSPLIPMLIVVLKVTVYRPTAAKKWCENSNVAIFCRKVEKTGFVPPPHFGGELGSKGGVGSKS